MKTFIGEISTAHARGNFCKRIITQNYFISYFETPFFYEREGTLEQGSAGDLLINPPGSPVFHGSYEEGFVNTWIHVHCDELAAVLEKYPLPLNTAFSVESDVPLRRYIEKVKKEYSVRAVGYEDQIFYHSAQLIIELYRGHRRADPYHAATRLELAREEIMQAPEKPWTLSEMAALCGYSASRFSALYKQQFGRSPKQDILNARIDLAARMLKYTNASVTEVATACGFQSIYYFSKYFKEITALSPKEYARKFKP